jgi:hypothetical protein
MEGKSYSWMAVLDNGCVLTVCYSQILDDDFLHALRIFRDSSSKAVRLIASVHGGELDRYVRSSSLQCYHPLTRNTESLSGTHSFIGKCVRPSG